MVDNSKIKRKENENEEQFLWRLGQLKDNGEIDLDWSEVAAIMNKEFRDDEDEYMGEAAYRKSYQYAKKFYDSNVFNDISDDEYLLEIRAAKESLRKEKQKLFDERTALNKVLREEGRRESMVDIVKHALDDYHPIKFAYVPTYVQPSDCDFIIHLTDIHCGMTVDSAFNKFSEEILEQRMKKFLDAIRQNVALYKPENAYLILGGDMIHGLIHLNARLESKENIVSQIMIIADLVSNFIYELSKMFRLVEVYTTVGNHSRSTERKEDSTTKENFDLLIPFVCKKDLKDIENVTFKDNLLGCDIAAFKVRGHMIYATHGDKDTVSNVVYDMTNFARKVGLPFPDICYLGHRHQNELTTVDDVKVIESGSVEGMDSYSIDHRLVGTPEQTVTVVTQEQRIKALCDIQIS